MTTVLDPQTKTSTTSTGLIMRSAPLMQLPKACPSHLCRFTAAPAR